MILVKRLSFLLTESPGEIKPLEAVLENKADVNVKVGTWKWSETSPWPPLHAVLSTPLWSDPKYDVLRQRLLRPAPNPSITVGGEFITVNVRAMAKAAVQKDKKHGQRRPVKVSVATSEHGADEPEATSTTTEITAVEV